MSKKYEKRVDDLLNEAIDEEAAAQAALDKGKDYDFTLGVEIMESKLEGASLLTQLI